ncbi:MAG TPA: cupin domain-containing protein [Clostridia bacterium]|nr:cupin domain-containing protein [Clostridia bacterium]
MSHTSILSGKVLKQSLPMMDTVPSGGAPLLKRLLLPQGELAQFYDADQGIRYMAFVEFLRGGLRGNHYHHVKEEHLYVIRGEVMLWVEDIDSHERDSLTLKAGDLVKIPTGIAHAVQTLQSGEGIEFSPARFDAKDIYRHSLV